MQRFDQISDRMRGRLGGGVHEAAHVSVLCDSGDEFVVLRDARMVRCPTCGRTELKSASA
jgi:hypothetical protein